MQAWAGVLGVVLASSAAPAGDLTFADRVRARERIERIYHAHQEGTTAPFEDAVPRARVEARVRDDLRKSAALERYWKTPITAEALRNEMERIARGTRFPERLAEIYDALGNDAVLVQETLARGTLADRWARSLFEFDPRIHDAARREAEELRARWMRDGGDVAPVVEEREAFAIEIAGGARVERRVVRKRSWEEWWAGAAPSFDGYTAGAVARGTLPATFAAGTSCRAGDSWDNGVLGAVPEGRTSAGAVWTGRLILVWGGSRDGRALASGGRYDPLTDAWTPISTVGAPAARWGETATWTGSRLIVWGGTLASGGVTASGASYDPEGDVWTTLPQLGAPAARQDHSAVWTGSHLVVWGGSYSNVSGTQHLDDGGRYDPASGTWSPVSAAGAPAGRRHHTAVWTGSAMVVWGGDRTIGATTSCLDDGGRYDPQTDAWLPLAAAGAPAARTYHGAVWTGSAMVVWGGQFYPSPGQRQYLGTGARYDPDADAWEPMSAAGAPSPRIGHAMATVGNLVVVWGGQGSAGLDASGGRYDPASDAWTPIASEGAPSPRSNGAVAWTGSRLVVWSGAAGGSFPDSGGRYDPAVDAWTPTFSQNAPLARERASVVWTGNEMIVWGGLHGEEPLASGGRYDPLTDSWSATALSPLNRPRVHHTAVWTGSRMLVWGGEPCPNVHDRGTSYDPITDTWAELDDLSEPAPRRRHTAVWTGSRMVVWGGLLCSAPPAVTSTGSSYDPVANAWSPTSAQGAPAARQSQTAVWTGSTMIVWGGNDEGTTPTVYDTGGRYDPVTDAWSPTRKQGAPAARREHTAVWTGSQMIVWGGTAGSDLDTGGRYDPAADQWTPTATAGAPSPRIGHAAVWADGRMVVWGGDTSAVGTLDAMNTGGAYHLATNAWTPTSTSEAPGERTRHAAVWTGTFMVVWGGVNSIEPDSGGRYVVQNPDADADGVADVCDCAPGDAAVHAIPPEVGLLTVDADKATVRWTSVAPDGGSSTVHDGIAGALGDLPVGSGAGIACVGPGTGASSVVDAEVPLPGEGRWYLVRGRNACGVGTYGTASGGAERFSGACP